jgi:hypothetical protein
MSASPLLHDQLIRMESTIAEIRRQELDVDTRLGEIQREKDELAAARGALEEAANVLRSRLTRSMPPTVVQFPASTSQHAGLRPASVPQNPPRRKGMRPESGIGRSYEVIKNLMIPQGGSARRGQIIERLREAELVGDGPGASEMASTILTKLKHRGYVTTDNHGTWSLTDAGS